jgi:hypothetical protein
VRVRLLACLSLAAACGRSVTEHDPIAQVLVKPQDVTSALPKLELTVSFTTNLDTDDELRAFGDRITAIRMSDGVAIPLRSALMTPKYDASINQGISQFRDVTVSASVPQPEGWYLVQLPQLPRSTYVAQPDQLFSDSGALAVRLHLGSHPVLRGFQACLKETNVVLVEVEFSEPVMRGSQGGLSVSSGNSPNVSFCQPAFDGAVTGFGWDFTCPSAGTTQVVRVVVGGDLSGASGVPVPAATETESIAAGALTTLSPCVVFKHPL